MTSDGRPYAPLRFKQIVEERYQISKHINTSYSDTADISPTERSYLLEFIKRDLEHEQELINKKTQELQNR